MTIIKKMKQHLSSATEARKYLYNNILEKYNRDKISCFRQECHGCCYEAVGISMAEAIDIVIFLIVENKWKNLQEKIEQRAAEEAAIETNNIREFADIWWKMALKCVFLNEKNRCSIYPIRPFPCAGIFSLSDFHKCYPPKIETVANVSSVIYGQCQWTWAEEMKKNMGVEMVFSHRFCYLILQAHRKISGMIKAKKRKGFPTL